MLDLAYLCKIHSFKNNAFGIIFDRKIRIRRACPGRSGMLISGVL